MKSTLVFACAVLVTTACGGDSKDSGGGVTTNDDAGADGSAVGGGNAGGAIGGTNGVDAGSGEANDGGGTAGGGGTSDAGDAGSIEPPIPGAFTGTTYYVSPSGSDSNAGTSMSAPWQTVAKIQATTFHPGDAVLLQGGQTFTGCLTFQPGRILSTRAAPFTVGSYGTGHFTLTANCTSASSTQPVAAITIASVNGFVLQDATIVGNAGGARYGVWIYNGTSAQTGGITVRSSDISGFYATGSLYGSEIFMSSDGATSTTVATSMDGISILHNVLHGSAGPTSPDDGGINGYGHGNITNVVYDGNLVYDTGGHPGAPNGADANGILAIGINGVVMQNNVVHDVGANTNTCGGPAGLWTYEVNNALVQFNEVYAVHPVNKTTGCDWGAYDFDQNTTDSTMQYNYAHDNYAEAYLMYGTGSAAWGTNIVRYNLSENDGEGFILNMDHGQVANIYNNTVYTSAASTIQPTPIAFEVANHAPNMGLVANNIFVVAPHGTDASNLVKTNGLDVTGLVMHHNDYYASSKPTIEWHGTTYTSVAAWTTATSADTAALAVDPLFVSAGTTGTCSSVTCGSGYELARASSLLGAGTNLTAAPYAFMVGTRDFLGETVPNATGTGYNVGAFSVAP